MTDPAKQRLSGLGIVALSLTLAVLVARHPEGLRAPAWVAYAAAGALALAGLSLMAQARGAVRTQAWLIVALLAVMAAIPAWIALGPGVRTCGVQIGAPLRPGTITGAERQSGLVCRAGFGAGGLLMVGLLTVAVGAALRSGRRP